MKIYFHSIQGPRDYGETAVSSGPGPPGSPQPCRGDRAMKSGFTQLAAAGVVGMALAAGGTLARSPENIVDTAVAAGQFKTLTAAINAAGLTKTLEGPGPFTVFAPTDAAFAKLPAGTVNNLLKPENKPQLVAILTYHVVPGTVMAADVTKLTEAKTVNG